MTDHRNFEWSEETADKISDLIQEAMWQEDCPSSIAGEVLVELLPIVKKALAEEYDRGYETALDMEVDPASARAWDEGFAEGVGYGAYLEGGYGQYPTPVNPYTSESDV